MYILICGGLCILVCGGIVYYAVRWVLYQNTPPTLTQTGTPHHFLQQQLNS